MAQHISKLAGMAAAVLTIAACSNEPTQAQSAFEIEGDRAKGSPAAPVVIVEYASVSCGTCANFHRNAMPTIERYIDSGDVRFVFREMIASQPELAIAGFMLANCAPDDRYFDVIDILFDQQQAMYSALQQGRAQSQLQSIALSAGFTTEEYRACLSDPEGLEAVQARTEAAAEAGVTGTPTFFINGDRVGRAMGGNRNFVWAENDEPLIDDSGAIPYQFDAATIERLIEFYLDDAV